jgi:hypothetical protein
MPTVIAVRWSAPEPASVLRSSGIERGSAVYLIFDPPGDGLDDLWKIGSTANLARRMRDYRGCFGAYARIDPEVPGQLWPLAYTHYSGPHGHVRRDHMVGWPAEACADEDTRLLTAANYRSAYLRRGIHYAVEFLLLAQCVREYGILPPGNEGHGGDRKNSAFPFYLASVAVREIGRWQYGLSAF